MKKLKNIAVALASIVIFTNITHAQALKASYSPKHETPLAVKYLGHDENYRTFQVTLKSEVPGDAIFTIADGIEGELYASSFQAGNKVQTVRIKKRDGQVLDFQLVIGKKTYSNSFAITTSGVDTKPVAETKLSVL